VEHATQALKLQREMGNRIGEANGLNNLAWCYVGLGDYAQALDCSRQALALQQAIGSRPGEAGTWDTLGYVHHHLDQYAEAASCYDRALQLQRQLDDRYEQAGTLGRLGDTYAAAGNTPSAHGNWYQALAILELHHPDAQQLHARLNSRRRS
jgi:tetratricopeptide (TPR) repeat protein